MTRALWAGLTLVWSHAAGAQQVAIDTTFDRLDRMPDAPAIGIAVWHRGRVVYQRTSGMADLERGTRATGDTRFDWASVAKHVTAYGISLLVEAGRLSPSDPVRRYLPELDLDGAPVTIDQLLHHTSGIEDADGLAAIAGWRPGDLLATEDLVRLLCAQRTLRFPPGERHAYSNSGYVLLSEVIARVTGRQFAAWADSAIFQSLGLRSSGMVSSAQAVIPDRALPYVRREGALLASWVDTYAGAGGLVATTSDLARWAGHLMAPQVQREAALRLRERGRLSSGEPIDYAWGLGWGVHRGIVTLSHSGSGPATDAMLLMAPDHDFAVVAAAAGPHSPAPGALAFRALEAWLADQLAPRDTVTRGRRMLMITEEMYSTPPPESEGVRADPAALRRYAGTYRFPDGAIVIRARGDRLEFSHGGRATWIPLFPLPDGRFAYVPVWDIYRFVTDSSGTVVELRRERNAKTLRDNTGTGLPLRVPPWDAGRAAPYVGWYVNDELGATYQVALEGERLVLRHPRHGVMRLTPLADDRFGLDSRSLGAVTFARAGDGPAAGLEIEAFSWGVRAAFRRLADR